MKNKIWCCLLSMALIFGMSACGAKNQTSTADNSDTKGTDDTPSTTESANAESKTSDSDKIQLEFWVPGTEEDMHWKALPAAAEAFNQANPGVEVKVVLGGPTDEYNKKLTMMADTDTLPDFFEAGTGITAGFGDAGVLTEITNDINSDSEWSSWKYVDGAYERQQENQSGKTYGVPLAMDAQGFFYNTKLLKDNGLEVPQTWDEFINVVKVLKAAGITPIAHGAQDMFDVWGYYGFFNRYGMADIGPKIKDGSATWSDSMMEPFKKIQELADLGAYPEGNTTITYAQAVEMFANGQAAILGDGAWDCSKLSEADFDAAFNWGPTFSDSSYDQKVALKGVSWTMFAGSSLNESDAKREAGIKFMKHMCSPETTKLLIQNGYYFPSYLADISDLDLPALTVSIYDAISDNEWKSTDESYAYVDSKIIDTFWNAITSLINQSMNAEEAAQQLDDFYNIMN